MATILVVDDRPENREYMVSLLRYRQHLLLEAADGAEALAITRSRHPDLIIADILMPTMDGFELVRQVRGDPAIAQTPVIFWTAHYHEREALSLARSCGVSRVVTKPSEPETILNAVEATLGPSSQPAPHLPVEECGREHLRLLTDKLSQKVDTLKTTNERQAALVDLNLQLASEQDLNRLLQNFGHAARRIIGARFSVVGILDEGRTRFQYVFTSGLDARGAAALGSPDPDASALKTILEKGRCIRLHNPGCGTVKLGLPQSHPPVRSWLGAPIASPTRVYGYVGLGDRIGLDEFTQEDERLAGILASQVGRIYQNGILYSELMNHAADLERKLAEGARIETALGADELAALSNIAERRGASAEQPLFHVQLSQLRKPDNVDRFVGDVAHDLNNLLGAINGYATLIANNPSTVSSVQESVREILNAGRHAAQLTRQLSRVSRITVPRTRPVDVNAVILGARTMLATVLGEDIGLDLNLNPSLGSIMADPEQIHRVLLNLAVNARDAMPEGGKLLIETKNIAVDVGDIERGDEAAPGPYVQVQFIDTGVGITREVMAHVFEPFFTTKKSGDEAGLGLSIVHAIVKNRGGSISVSCEPGEGATFTINIPQVDIWGSLQQTTALHLQAD